MNWYLAIETATDYGSVAVGRAGEPVAQLALAKRRHARDLMSASMEVMRLAEISLASVSGIVVGDGPGSFTGLRVGFATAIAIQRDYPGIVVYTVPSLLSVAFGARKLGNGSVVAMYDALRGEVYGAVYRFEQQKVICDLPPTLGTVAQLRVQCASRPGLAVGDGALLHGDAVRQWTSRDPVGPPDLVPQAAAFLELLAFEGAVRRVDNPRSFEPEYGRLAEAQARLERAEKNPKKPG